MARLDRKSRVRDVYAHPLGRDIIDKLLLHTGISPRWILNPVAGNLRLGRLDQVGRRAIGPGFVDTLISLLNDHPDEPARSESAGTSAGEPAWWKEAVFYQVYPRSFQDSDGDGLGDLRGIISRLDYLQDLGVDCVWLSPIFDSPNEDMGYDIRDYRRVMAEMGTSEDLDELIEGCHERGMRIILDLVVNHTSAEHEWFRSAVDDPDGPYGDYYFLRRGEPGEDGTGAPPNNWVSFFSGSAWRWIPDAERWALHLFGPGQMDLNWANPTVRGEVAEVVQFWLARGIDGFRLDVINYISKRPGLPNGNEFIGRLMEFTGIEHYYVGPQLHAYLRELRRRGFTRGADAVAPSSSVRLRLPDGTLGDPLPPDPVGVMVGETPGVGIEIGRLLSGADRGELDMVFNFDVLEPPGKVRWDDYRYDLNYLKDFSEGYLDRIGSNDWIALFLENHDNPRMISKVLGPDDHDPGLRTAVARVLATIQLTLRGTPFLYQGQELAAINQDFTSIGDLRDLESLNRYAELRSNGATVGGAFDEILPGARDHARVPMRWEPVDGGGFTDGTPWLHGVEDSTGFTVAEQRADPESVFNWYRDLIRLRRQHEAFTYGSIEFVAPGARDYFAWFRTSPAGDRWLIEVNLADAPVQRRNGSLRVEVKLGTTTRRGVTMAPYEVMISRVFG
ncbi:MAG TPA: alpha-glucosidase [Actinomycetaceae bacterium]|nr:alpha-glucosidase [Actinomycetaceae bacterium]